MTALICQVNRISRRTRVRRNGPEIVVMRLSAKEY